MLKLKNTILLISISILFLFNFQLENLKLGLDLKGGSSILLDTEDFLPKFKKDKLKEINYIIERNDFISNNINIIESEKSIDFKILFFSATEATKFSNFIKEYRWTLKQDKEYLLISFSKRSLNVLFKSKMVDLVSKIKNRLDQYGLSEPYVVKDGLRKVYIELPGVTKLSDLNDNIELIKTTAALSFNGVKNSFSKKENSDNSLYFKSKENPNTLYDLGPDILSGDNITTANTTFIDGRPAVDFSLDAFGAEAFASWTEKNAGTRLAIVIDGEVLSAPMVHGRIGGGSAQITGDFTVEETKRLTIALKSGALPFDLTLEETKIIGPSLGEDNIKTGILSLACGFALVLLFLLYYYKKNGIIILSALFFNLLLIFMLVYSFGFVLTLPGIAGLILTIGMAIDANIIIQERIKEFIAAGKELSYSVTAGYQEAKIAIFDANVTTILVGVVLYTYGTGPLKSFALILIIGILCSIYTSVYFTEEILNHFKNKNKLNTLYKKEA